jgi:PilZ domain
MKMAGKAFPSEHRRTMRLDVRFNAGLREPGSSQKFEVEVIDLSMTGFRFETSFTIRPGSKVFVTIPGMSTLDATVHWGRGFIYGAQFDQPLYAGVFDMIAARHKKA